MKHRIPNQFVFTFVVLVLIALSAMTAAPASAQDFTTIVLLDTPKVVMGF
jgi:hypothetical protein